MSENNNYEVTHVSMPISRNAFGTYNLSGFVMCPDVFGYQSEQLIGITCDTKPKTKKQAKQMLIEAAKRKGY